MVFRTQAGQCSTKCVSSSTPVSHSLQVLYIFSRSTGDRFWVTESDTAPILVSEGEVECAAQFPYLGSVVSA